MDLISNLNQLKAIFAELEIEVKEYEHAALMTVQDAKAAGIDQGLGTKNLFLKDSRAKKFYLCTVHEDYPLDLKALRKKIKAKSLSFASPDQLQEYLGILPGSVSLLALVHDKDKQVEVIIDKNLLGEGLIQSHPLVNNKTWVFSVSGLKSFLDHLGREYQELDSLS
jgi:Ala-tRNA(Pro) deacylase